MPFQNVIMPDTTPSEMKGVMALLALIGNPQSQAAAGFLTKLSEEKDAAVEAAKQAAADKAEAATLATSTKEHHDAIEGRLAKTDVDLRARIDAHAKAAAKLQEREDDLRVRQTAHASAVAAHQKEVEAAKTSHEVREAAFCPKFWFSAFTSIPVIVDGETLTRINELFFGFHM